MSGREQILNAVRQGLDRCRPTLRGIADSASHEAPGHVHPPVTSLADQFAAEIVALAGTVQRCANDAEALSTLRAILTSAQATSVVAWSEADTRLAGLDGLLRTLAVARVTGPRSVEAAMTNPAERRRQLDSLAQAQVGITGVDVAIAESGTLVLASGTDRGRLASLLPPVHVAVVHEDQIVRGLGEALARVRPTEEGGRAFGTRSSITCITGPSRTADIELTLTLGVHGPGQLHVLVIAAS